MATKWKDITHKFSDEEPQQIKLEAATEAECFRSTLGGQSELQAVFPDGEFILDQLGPAKRVRSRCPGVRPG